MAPATQSSGQPTTTTNNNKRIKVLAGLLVVGVVVALAVVFGGQQQRHAKESKVAGAGESVVSPSLPPSLVATTVFGNQQHPLAA